MNYNAFVFVVAALSLLASSLGFDEPCKWSSLTGSHYDLTPLTKTDAAKAYMISDGDIPCTPETEPTYSFMWNFCGLVSNSSMPAGHICKPSQLGAAMQFLNRSDGYKECHVIGRYDATKDDASFGLLDVSDPSKGVSIKYTAGEKCWPTGVLRTATIEVKCDNVKAVIESALEPELCQYHLVMSSYHGCPTECPITQKGLCNDHGHCSYDVNLKQPYCFCNVGWMGADCSTKIPSTSSAFGYYYSVQIGLLITLLIITLLLLGVVAYMVLRITAFRKEQSESTYNSLPAASSHHTSTEMTHTF